VALLFVREPRDTRRAFVGGLSSSIFSFFFLVRRVKSVGVVGADRLQIFHETILDIVSFREIHIAVFLPQAA
jgi:hypothetical protein